MPERTMTLSNSRYQGTTTHITGYALEDNNRMFRIVGIDFGPKHPKEQGALWAELVSGTPRWLWLKDNSGEREYREYSVIGLGTRYERLAVDVPEISIPMAANVRPKAVRCFSPLCHRIEQEKKDTDRKQRFYILQWPNQTFGQTLVSMMERDLSYPILPEWGEPLIKYGIEHGNIKKLLTAGTFPQGYEVITPEEGWLKFLGSAIEDGVISIQKEIE